MNQLATLEEATRMLAECRTVDDAKKIRDLAEAARVYAREADLGQEAMNHAAEIKLRAERRCGAILQEMAEDGTRRAAHRPAAGDNSSTLEQLGIERKEAASFQRLADADELQFETYIAEAKESGAPITTQGAIRYLTPDEKREREERTQELFVIYRALEAIATYPLTPKQYVKLDHGPSRFRVEEHLDAAWKWIDGLREQWQTT